jgi:hypothetical protein
MPTDKERRRARRIRAYAEIIILLGLTLLVMGVVSLGRLAF